MNKFFFLLALSVLVCSCGGRSSELIGVTENPDANDFEVFVDSAIEDAASTVEFETVALSAQDDSLLNYYRRTIVCEYMGCPRDTALTGQQLEVELEALGDLTLEQGTVIRSPDNRFTILVYQGEGCGAYCSPLWESFIIFEVGEFQVSKRMNFNTVSEIVDMKDGNYLILESSYGRPASTYTVDCGFASLITFEDTNVVTLPAFEGETSFGYCQEMDVDLGEESYIYFDAPRGELNYYYGNNYSFSHGVDIDTLRKGEFVYVDGDFKLEFEDVQVYSRVGK